MVRAASGWIDEKSTTSLPRPGDRGKAIGAEHHVFDGSRIGDAHEDDVGSGATSRGERCGLGASLDQRLPLAADLFQTVTSWPAWIRRRLIGNPIIPSPR